MSSLKRIYFILTGTVLIIILSSFFLIPFLVKKIENLSKEYTDGQAMLVQIQQKELLLERQKQLFEKAQAKLSRTEKSFLKSEDLVNFIASLEKIAGDNNIKFEIKSVSSPEKDKQYFTFSIRIRGSFPNILRFLFALENTPEPPYRLTEIKSITIKRINPPEGAEVRAIEVEGILEMRIYTDI